MNKTSFPETPSSEQKVPEDSGNSVDYDVDVREIRIGTIGRGEPLVFFFGPPNIGKTVSLIRLIRYLSREASPRRGYEVLGKTFRSDNAYLGTTAPISRGIRDRFIEWVESDSYDRPPGTLGDQFLAVSILDKPQSGNPLCTFVELPGELLFTSNAGGSILGTAPRAINDILKNQDRRKVVLFMMPLNTQQHEEMPNDLFVQYCTHVQNLCLNTFDPEKDTFAFVIPKADLHKAWVNGNSPDVDSFRKALVDSSAFKVVLDAFVDRRMKISLIPYSAGEEYLGANNAPKFDPSPAVWSKRLWDDINDLINNGASSQPSFLSSLFKRRKK